MSQKIIYRKELLRAVDAFLEGTSASLAQAHRIIQRCYAAMQFGEEVTLNDIIWDSFVRELTDSVFYTSETFLREAREMLLGHASQPIARTIFGNDYRPFFTTDEEQLYSQLISLLDFIAAVPFAAIHEATHEAWLNKATWATVRPTLPEAAQAEQIDEEYWQRKALIEEIAARSLPSEDVGEEKIHRLVLREVTNILTALRVGLAAISSGYPALDAPYTDYRVTTLSTSAIIERIDATESLSWARKALDAISGKGTLFLSWRLSKAPTFDGDLLIVSFH